MMGLRFKSKADARRALPFPAESKIIETSFFGPEYKGDGTYTVCVSLDPYTVRNSFGTITVKDGLVVAVK